MLASSFLLSIMVVSWFRLQIPSDQLFYIRVQQVFGLLCVLYWYLALIISPLGYVIGKSRTKWLEFTRRGIGVSAFYYALLHGLVAVWGQLGGPGQLQYLPSLSRWSILAGAAACTVLLIMAATSIDRVVEFMTYHRWKWLHRLVYIAGTLAVLHVWSIGTHLVYAWVQYLALALLVSLSGLELFRVTKILSKKYQSVGGMEAAALFLSAWAVVVTLILFIPYYIPNYHRQHTSGESSGSHQEVHP